tara:strand:- start:89 stop:286 length:198 start_codon:yes stop_codon:yes gene_type:complete
MKQPIISFLRVGTRKSIQLEQSEEFLSMERIDKIALLHSCENNLKMIREKIEKETDLILGPKHGV